MENSQVINHDERLEQLRRTPPICSFSHAIINEDVRVVSMCPATEPWHVTITAETIIKQLGQLPWEWEKIKEESETFPVIGWGVLADGTVEPLFIEIGISASAATCPSEYRRHNHDCDIQEDGSLETTLHHIVVEKS